MFGEALVGLLDQLEHESVARLCGVAERDVKLRSQTRACAQQDPMSHRTNVR
jgi:hypothetical protein